MGRRNDISLAQAVLLVTEGRRLRDEGMPINRIARELGVGDEWIRRRLIPGHREKANAAWRADHPPTGPSKVKIEPYRPKKDEVDRLRASIPKDTRDFTQRFCGDPLPGRSALDRRRA